MNRRMEIQYEAGLPQTVRYTVWLSTLRAPRPKEFTSTRTLAEAIDAAQHMEPKGYITPYGKTP